MGFVDKVGELEQLGVLEELSRRRGAQKAYGNVNRILGETGAL